MKEESSSNLEELETLDIHKFFASENKKTNDKSPTAPKIRSVYLMYIFSLITLGIYTSLWFRFRSNELGSLETKRKISKIIPLILIISNLAAVLSLIFLLLSISPEEMGVLYQNISPMQYFLMIVFLTGSIIAVALNIILSFYSRAIINESLKFNKNLETKLSGFLAFIFGAFYIQYEINRIVADKEESKRTAPWVVLGILVLVLVAILALA